MAVMKELLIGQDEQRSNNPIDCTAVEAPKATSVMDAVRMACATLGIDHDVAECIAAGTQARMQPTAEQFFICPDGSAVDSIYVSDYGYPRLVTAEEICKPTIESVIRSVDPKATTQRFMSVYPDWQHGKAPRTLAQAEEIAAAIVAEHGGSVEVQRFEKHPGKGAVDVDTCKTQISIFFDSEEAALCSES